MKLTMIFFWLSVGQIAYQCFGKYNWLEALDHIYWQAWAILAVWLYEKMRSMYFASQDRNEG